MLLALRMPFIDSTVESATVAMWHKEEGEQLLWGEAVCEVAVEECRRIFRDSRPKRLARLLERPYGIAKQDVYAKRVDMRVVLVAGEAGRLGRVLVPEGASVAIGDPLALASMDGNGKTDELGVKAEDAPTFLLIPRISGSETYNEFY